MNPAEIFAEALHRFQTGDSEGALPLVDQLAAVMPSQPEVWQLGGLAAFTLGRFTNAAYRFARARALEPDNPAHAINLANALIKLDRDAEAAEELDAALVLDPHSADAEVGLGTLARRAGRLEEAELRGNRALALRPASYEGAVNRGRALHELGRFDEAIRSYEAAIAIHPQAAPAHAQMALSLLLTGDWGRGWREYEWRGEGSDVVSRDRFTQPEWQGEDLRGAVLLVHAEQGFGDTIQFARFLPIAEARGARVILEVQPTLKKLFTSFTPSLTVIARGDPLPPFARHVRLMSLPYVLGIGLDTMPPPAAFAPRPPDAGLPRDPRLTVGLCWAGRSAHENDRNRSISPDLLAPLGRVPGVRFVSVQKDRQRAVPNFVELDLGPRLRDFTELAGVLQEVDLLITVDTAPAHMMGSLGRPVWVLLPDPPDWRWLLGREDSPWYPTASLFRQRRPGDWPEVIERVGAALQAFCAEKAGVRSPCSD